jgi:CRP-like cAMP-binding protein
MKAPSLTAFPNRLLAALPAAARGRFVARCDDVDLTFAEVLCESGDPVQYVYFPRKGFVSIVTALDDTPRLEIGMIGDEGMLGTSLILGVGVSQQHAVVQGEGSAWRMTARDFRRGLSSDAALKTTLNRYVYVLMGQLAQTAACTSFHGLDARLARWLLLTRDRSHSNSFSLTHEFLAYMLGVRRAGVTSAAKSLRDRGLIDYNRGEIRIMNGSGLEKASCDCYWRLNDMYSQILGVH